MFVGLGSGLDVTIINGSAQLGSEGLRINKQMIAILGGLARTGLVRLAGTGLAEPHNGVGHLLFCSHPVVQPGGAPQQEAPTRGGRDQPCQPSDIYIIDLKHSFFKRIT